jgi:hypothetical protein
MIVCKEAKSIFILWAENVKIVKVITHQGLMMISTREKSWKFKINWIKRLLKTKKMMKMMIKIKMNE